MTTEMKLKFNAKEKVLLLMTALMAPILSGEIYGMLIMRQGISAFHTNPNMPQFYELFYGFGLSFIFMGLRYVITKLFRPIGQAVIEEKKRNQDRIERFTTVLFKFIYFVMVSSAGFYVLKDEPWFPPILGGSGDLLECFRTVDRAPSSMLKMYWFVQLGYHTHSLLYMLFLSPIRNDFLEMLVHHLATICMIATSYVANNHAMGALVAFVHDLSDVTAYGIKVVVDTGRTSLVIFMYFAVLISWAYTRLYVYPTMIYNVVFKAPEICKEVSFVFLYSTNLMLCTLQALHIYWYGLVLVMGYMLLVKGKAEDIQQKIPDAVKTTKQE